MSYGAEKKTDSICACVAASVLFAAGATTWSIGNYCDLAEAKYALDRGYIQRPIEDGFGGTLWVKPTKEVKQGE